jgi:hypothetical protein
MKRITLAILSAACGLGVATAGAQTTTTVTTTKEVPIRTRVTETTSTTTTDTSGTIAEYAPGREYFTMRAGTTGAPARFYYNNDAHVFDPEGHPLSWSVLRPDIPAKVYYVRDGDRMIVRKVVVTKPVVVEKKTTTTTVERH